MATVRLHRAFAGLFPGAPATLELDAATVGDAIAALDARWPGMGDRIRIPGGPVRPNIRVFVDGTQAELATPVAAGSTVHVLLATEIGRAHV